MQQLDLLDIANHEPCSMDRPSIVERLGAISARPRFAFFVLDLIARASEANGSVGPYVMMDNEALPVRDWLCDAMVTVSGREPSRLAMVAAVRRELQTGAHAPRDDPGSMQARVDEEVRTRLRRSGRANISRAVSDLVKAGFVRRHYQGYAVDHHNRGAQRQAVYQVTEQARLALRSAT